MRARRLVILSGLSILVLLALSLSLHQIVSSTARAAGEAMAVDCDASDIDVDASCSYGPDAVFKISVQVTNAGDGYAGYQAKVRWTDAALDYNPTTDPADEDQWPDCTIRARTDNQPADPSVLYGCSTFGLPPPISQHTGELVEFEMTCSTAGGETDVILVPRSGDPQLGTYITTTGIDQIDPALANSHVSCAAGATPTPTNTLIPPSATPTTGVTPSATPSATASATAGSSPTPSVTPTPSLTRTPTNTRTPTQPATPCVPECPTSTDTPTGAATETPTETATETPTATDTAISTPGTPGATSEATLTMTPTTTPTPTATATDSRTPTPPVVTATTTSTRTRTATPTRTPRERLGDVDKDGRIDPVDAQLILQFSSRLLPSINATGDVDENGSLNAIDARLILLYAAGLLATLP